MKDTRLPDWLQKYNHVRFNPLTGQNVLVSPARLNRKWAGASTEQCERLPAFDPTCPFCPGNQRANNDMTPKDGRFYPFYFINDTGAVVPPSDEVLASLQYEGAFHSAKIAFGICEVVVHHHRHDFTLATMPQESAVSVVNMWIQRYRELADRAFIRSINIFENYLFGASQKHPHNQIWAANYISPSQKVVLGNLQGYLDNRSACMLQDIAAFEVEVKERVVWSDDHFVIVVPFWAEWPFEMMIIPMRALDSVLDMTEEEIVSFIKAYSFAIHSLNSHFGGNCPYTAGLYQAPTDGSGNGCGFFHAIFRPPVLRSIGVYKWMVGYELMASPQRDLTPERAASLLRGED